MRRGMIWDSQVESEDAKVDIYYSTRESWLLGWTVPRIIQQAQKGVVFTATNTTA
jgi:hypothetical protein